MRATLSVAGPELLNAGREIASTLLRLMIDCHKFGFGVEQARETARFMNQYSEHVQIRTLARMMRFRDHRDLARKTAELGGTLNPAPLGRPRREAPGVWIGALHCGVTHG